METPDYCIAQIIALLKASPAAKMISGQVLEVGERAENSTTQDITVGAITMSSGFKQYCTLNINIFCPDIKKEGLNSFYVAANSVKLKAISKEVVSALKGNAGVYLSKGNLWISNISGIMSVEGIDQHFINIRVEFRVYNN